MIEQSLKYDNLYLIIHFALNNMFDPKHSMTAVSINNINLIKLEDNPPFTKGMSRFDNFSDGSVRVSNLNKAHIFLVVFLDSLILDSHIILTSCSSKCLLISRNLQENSFVSLLFDNDIHKRFFSIFYFCNLYLFIISLWQYNESVIS